MSRLEIIVEYLPLILEIKYREIEYICKIGIFVF